MTDIRELSYKGFYTEIRSDSFFFTVYDTYHEPVGTIQRPSLHNKEGWISFNCNGQQLLKNGVGPNQCLRSLAIYHGA